MRAQGMHCKKTGLHDFPDKSFANDAFTHDLMKLVELAGLKLQLKLDTTPATNPQLGINWQFAKKWNEKARYDQIPEANAVRLFEAVTDPTNGVLTWIKLHW
jgi:hypothetical protein